MTRFSMRSMHGRHGFRRTAIVMFLGWLCLMAAATTVCIAEPVTMDEDKDGPAQTVYAPDSGRGRVIILISGHSGPTSYKSYAADLATPTPITDSTLKQVSPVSPMQPTVLTTTATHGGAPPKCCISTIRCGKSLDSLLMSEHKPPLKYDFVESFFLCHQQVRTIASSGLLLFVASPGFHIVTLH